MAGQAFRFCQGFRGAGGGFPAGKVCVRRFPGAQRRDGFQEMPHGKPAGKGGSACCGQRMIQPCRVVAEYFRRAVAGEQAAVIPQACRQLIARRAGIHGQLQMLRRFPVGDFRRRFQIRNRNQKSVVGDAAVCGAVRRQRVQPMQALIDAIRGSDAVINLAAEHRDDVTPKTLYDEVNVEGSRHVCDACTALSIRTIVFTSSVAVYGFAPAGTDESGAIAYFNDYGRTKYLAEGVYRGWLAGRTENCAVIIRPTVIFGEQNRGNVYNLLRQIAGGKFPMVGSGTNRKSMNYVENAAAFLQYCIEHTESLPCFDGDFDGKNAGRLHLFNYCDEPAYDMNTLVLDVYRALGRQKKRIFHWPYWLGYFGGLCFDLLAKVLHKKLPVSSIRVKKFCQNTYFTSCRVPQTGFIAPVSLEEGIRRTIDYEFIQKVQGHTFKCE